MSSTIFGSRNPFHGMRRYPDNGVIAGVCEGLAVHFDWNPRMVRAIALLLVIFTGFWPTVVAYLVMWYIVEPVKGAPPGESTVVPPTPPGAEPRDGAARPVPMPELKARFRRLDERLRRIEECVTDHAFELRQEFRKLGS